MGDKLLKRVDDIIGDLAHCDLRTSVGVEKASAIVRKAIKKQTELTMWECRRAVAIIDRDDDGNINKSDALLGIAAVAKVKKQ